ncbi:uncharacterized protein witty [Eurosta solidaginis]|uniref:uncharacterized protein witty n=1 Tax=Eurosta solidaginis TaxID=178769 RepID=UPI0035311D9F
MAIYRYYYAPKNMRDLVILTVFLLLQCIQNGAAIKCFVCDSSDNPSCANLKSNRSIVAEECTLDKMRTTYTWLFQLNRIEYFDTGTRDGPLMNCQKVVALDNRTSKMVTARFCQLDTADSDACQIFGNKLGWPPELARNANADNNGNNNKNHVNRKANKNGKNSGADENQNMELHCSICDKDSCNGSQSVRQWNFWFASVLPALITQMIRLRHSAW